MAGACTNDGEDAATTARRCGLPSPETSIPIDEQLVFVPTLKLALVVTFADPSALTDFMDKYKNKLLNDSAFQRLAARVTVNSGLQGRLVLFDFDRGASDAADACSLFDALRQDIREAKVQFVAT
jgi:hypothetical protein